MRNITVVIGTDEVKEILLAWRAAGLISPFLWWEEETAGRHQVSGSDGSGSPLPLLDALAATKYDRVRLILLRTLSGQEIPPEPVRLSLRIRDVIERHLGQGQRLSTVGVLVPATGVTEVAVSALSNRWDTIAVAVDQDGVDPSHTSREIRSADDLAVHAALTAATVGGLWPGMDTAPFDDETEGTGHQEPRVRLVRTHARAVHGHGLATEIVRATLARRRDPEWAAQRAKAVPAPTPERIAERAAGEYLDGPGARLRHAPHVSRRRRLVRVTPRVALRLLWLFVRGRLSDIQDQLVARAVDEFHGRVERFVQQVTFGADSGVVVKFDGRELAPEKLTNLEITAGTVELAGALLTEIDQPAVPGRFAAEWKALRKLGFGLVDAGELPEGCTEPLAGTHRQVLAAASISPPPAAPEKSLQQWQDESPESLLSRIGTRMLSDADAANSAFLGALIRLRNASLQLTTSRPANTSRWRVWLAICGLAAIVVVGGVVAGSLGLLDWPTALLLSGGAAAGFVVGSAVVMFREYREQFQDAYRVNQIAAECENARAAAEHEAAELIRLTAACGEYQDVAATIAMVTHLAGGEGAADPNQVDLASLARPLAFGVAKAETAPATLARLASIVGNRCFTTGWTSALYAEVAAKSVASLKFDQGLAESAPGPDPDIDPSARRALCADLRKGAADRLIVDSIRELVTNELPEHQFDELFSSVRPVGGEETSAIEFLTGLCVTTETGAWTFNSRYWNVASGHHAVVTTTRIWLPETLCPEFATGAIPIREPDLGADPIVVHSARADVTPPVRWSDLALFARELPGEEPLPTADLGDIG